MGEKELQVANHPGLRARWLLWIAHELSNSDLGVRSAFVSAAICKARSPQKQQLACQGAIRCKATRALAKRASLAPGCSLSAIVQPVSG